MRIALAIATAAIMAATGRMAAPLTPPVPSEVKLTQANWATYLRAGPGDNFGSIDEVDHGDTVAVVGCAHDWCQVTYGRAAGYIEQDALTLRPLPSGRAAAAGSQGCFSASSVGYLRPVAQRFCEIAK